MKVQGFVIEFIISALLVLVVFGAAADEEASFAYHSCFIIFANTVVGKLWLLPREKKKLSPSIPVPNIQGVFLLVPPKSQVLDCSFPQVWAGHDHEKSVERKINDGDYLRAYSAWIRPKSAPWIFFSQQERFLSIGLLTNRHVWKFSNLPNLCQNYWARKEYSVSCLNLKVLSVYFH